MEELDLLKKDWNKDHYPKVTENEIYKLMLKNSSSTVKWILIISLLELSFGIFLSIGMSFTKFDQENTELLKNMGIYNYYIVFTIFLYAVIAYFIIRFYLMYKKVSTTDNTKLLMKNILKTRKTVQNYILFNLVAFAIFFISILSYGFKIGIEKATIENSEKVTNISSNIYIISFVVVVFATGIVTTAFWFIYKLMYGFLLKKLKKNHEELKKIDL